jgi:hypothetical protein
MSLFTENGSHCPQSAIKVELGNVCCAVICHDHKLGDELGHLFENFQSHQPADITIELKVVNGKSPSEVEAALPRIKIVGEGNHFAADDLVLEGEFNALDRSFCFKVERAFFEPNAEFKLMNRILTLVYYTVCQWKFGGQPPAMIVHSAGIVRLGKALLFIGPSGSGKTTIARFCGREQGEVLNDEMTLVSHQSSNGKIMVRGIPIIGGTSQKSNIEAPLSCIFSLKQSKRTAVHHLNRVEAYLRFIRQVISPAYFGQTNRQELLSQIAEFADEVTGIIPFYELEFTLDKDWLWQVVSELENTLDKEEVKIG